MAPPPAAALRGLPVPFDEACVLDHRAGSTVRAGAAHFGAVSGIPDGRCDRRGRVMLHRMHQVPASTAARSSDSSTGAAVAVPSATVLFRRSTPAAEADGDAGLDLPEGSRAGLDGLSAWHCRHARYLGIARPRSRSHPPPTASSYSIVVRGKSQAACCIGVRRESSQDAGRSRTSPSARCAPRTKRLYTATKGATQSSKTAQPCVSGLTWLSIVTRWGTGARGG